MAQAPFLSAALAEDPPPPQASQSDPGVVAGPAAGSIAPPSLPPSPRPLRALTQRDQEALREAEKRKAPEPFSERDLGFGLPRISSETAARVTLGSNPQVLFQETEVEGSAGAVQVQEGRFDTNVEGRVSLEGERNERELTPRTSPGAAAAPTPFPNPLVSRRGVAAYELGARKRLANGIVINPNVGFRQAVLKDFGGQFDNANQGTANFRILIPLGKGGGTLVNKAPEIAARFDLLASVLQLRFVTSESVFRAIDAYWALKAAEENYRLQRESEKISDRLMEISTALVRGDELAPAQLWQILADRDSTTASRIRAEADLIAARETLAIVMGAPPSSLLLAPLAEDEFPAPPDKSRFPDVTGLISSALALRDDLRASQQLVKSRKVLVEAAWLDLRPTIDLEFIAGLAPLSQRTNAALTDGNTLSGTAALTFEWPVENNAAIGTYIQSEAAYASSEIAVVEIERRVVAEVISALAALKAAAENVQLLGEAARFYRNALTTQQELFELGQGLLTDTITARQRLVSAQLGHVAAQREYAVAIARLRFVTGTLIFSDEKGDWIDREVWTTVPFLEQ